MKFERFYTVNWTYHTLNSNYCYSEYKSFDTELERNRFVLELFSKNKNGEIVLVWLQEQDIKTWS